MEDFGEWSVEEFPQHANQEECLRDPRERGVKCQSSSRVSLSLNSDKEGEYEGGGGGGAGRTESNDNDNL
jgi:hypothetical protein